ERDRSWARWPVPRCRWSRSSHAPSFQPSCPQPYTTYVPSTSLSPSSFLIVFLSSIAACSQPLPLLPSPSPSPSPSPQPARPHAPRLPHNSPAPLPPKSEPVNQEFSASRNQQDEYEGKRRFFFSFFFVFYYPPFWQSPDRPTNSPRSVPPSTSSKPATPVSKN